VIRHRFAFACLLLSVALAGCMPFGRSDPLRIVAPAPTVATDPEWPRVDWSLLVQRPIADQTRGSTRVVVRTGGARLAYYPGIAWLDELPEMLQSEFLRAFADSGRVGAVARPGVARARYALASEIRRFDAVEESRGNLVVELELQVGLLEVRTGELLASRVFRNRTPVDGNDADALTAAFERALGELIGDVVGWTLSAPPAVAEKSAPGR
jgi:cholesterol transport system auxiliary component